MCNLLHVTETNCFNIDHPMVMSAMGWRVVYAFDVCKSEAEPYMFYEAFHIFCKPPFTFSVSKNHSAL